MAKIVFGMNQSLDGYVDHEAAAPDAVLFRHFIEQVRNSTACVYGRRLYEIMRYWDEDQDGWSTAEIEFAHAWRNLPKWVASRTLNAVGPNATLISNNIADVVRTLKQNNAGQIDIGGPILANHLTELGLIDEYQIYLHPTVLGQGNPFFAGPRPPLRLTASERIGENVIKLTYVPI